MLQEISGEITPERMKGWSPTKNNTQLWLKLQYFGHLMRRVNSLEKDSDAGGDWGQEEKGTKEDEMAGWHH